ncbi:hypothetical protein PVK06_024969 [Gossypium arboreum]|uniref:RNase H type-1 domain-containing protein n=1 Tax=Gossypium arboreum TaxID=29729 RepID=A0ABR0PF47_GOSAR|nr:hypothetical protein PVK06_024969 [Gossypium arboreum]
MLPKINIFSWRIGYNILPTFDNIARIRQGFQNICPRCKDREEMLIHAMKDCQKACEILAAGGLNNRLLTGEYTNCIDWLEDVFHELDKKAAADFLTLLWNSWNDRNNMIFKGKMDEAVTVWERATMLSKDFRIYNMTEPAIIPLTLTIKEWRKPLSGYIKVNVDAAVINGSSGLGTIARDQDGFIIGGCYNFVDKAMDVNWAELEALKEGLNLAARLKIAWLIVESDSAGLVNSVNKRNKDITIFGQHIKQTCSAFNFFDSVHVNWISRTSNNAVDLLCHLALGTKLICILIWIIRRISMGGGEIERTEVVQGTAHAHLMPRRRCPPSPVRFPVVSSDQFRRCSGELSRWCSEHRHIAAWTCWSLGHHRQPRTLVVREPQAASAPWYLGCVGASSSTGTLVLECAGALSSIDTLVPRMCGSLEQHQHHGASDTIGKLGPWLCRSLGHHQHLGGCMCESLSTTGNLVLWSCGSLEHHQ